MQKWTGLLDWSTRHHDGTVPSEARPMTKEDRDFLEKALDESMIREDAKMMREIVDDLKNPDRSAEQQEESLQDLLDYIVQIDNANDLHKIGGLQAVAGFLESPEAGPVCAAADCVAAVVQNNPEGQEAVLSVGGLSKALALLTNDDAAVRAKGVYVLSGLLRNCAPALREFEASDGLAALASTLSQNPSKARTKALFLMPALFHESTALASRAIELSLHTALAPVCAQPEEVGDDRRHAQLCLTELCQADPGCFATCAGLGIDAALAQLEDALEAQIRQEDDADAREDLQQQMTATRDLRRALTTPPEISRQSSAGLLTPP
mmetsp:Transcript_24497/g.57872  ORF Transcript_24497/g.57872 Transcript_24497/m.57872 type:complete len:322 (+) Transcript_24497:29-994(+)